MSQITKIVYVTNARLPTEKAHGLSTVKLCEAFVNQGCGVNLVSPFFWRISEKDLFNYYGVKRNFSVKKIFTIDLMPLGVWRPLAFFIQVFSFSIFSLPYILYKY